MRIRIVSSFALQDPKCENYTWDGEVFIPSYANDSSDSVNEFIFKRFNRVTEEDAQWLKEMSYNLPSLSVSDLVVWLDESRYRTCRMFIVKPAGFEEIRRGLGRSAA